MPFEIIRAIIFTIGWIAFGLLSGLLISRVALLPILGIDQREITLSVSATFLAAVLCFSLLRAYGGVITTIADESCSWSYSSTGSFYPGPFYNVDEKMHNNRDAIATELWKRLTLLRPQTHCFTSEATVCDLADQIESENPGLTRNILCSITLFTLSAALTCTPMTRHYLIRKQAAEMKKTPEQMLAHKQLLAYIRIRKTYPMITLILISSLSIGLCLCSAVAIPTLGPRPARKSATTELAIPGNDRYYVYFTDAEGVHRPHFYNPHAENAAANAPVEMSGKAIWLGPWHTTLAPGIAVGLCITAAIALVLLAFLKKAKAHPII